MQTTIYRETRNIENFSKNLLISSCVINGTQMILEKQIFIEVLFDLISIFFGSVEDIIFFQTV